MIPLGDESRRPINFPMMTLTIIGVNIFVFILELLGGDAFINYWSLVPANIMTPHGFITIFTSMFMHAGWVHLLGNMLYLWIFGDNVEDRLGHGLFLGFYILCGLGATFAQLAFSLGSNVPNLGASGAIAGVLGAYIVMFPRGRVSVLMGRAVVPMSALIVIGFWIVLQIFSGIDTLAASSQTGGGVAYMAHVGGFISGVILTFLLGGTRRALPPPRSYRN